MKPRKRHGKGHGNDADYRAVYGRWEDGLLVPTQTPMDRYFDLE